MEILKTELNFSNTRFVAKNPDDTKTMRLFKDAKKIKLALENARVAHQNRKFAEAVEMFTEALESTEFIPEKSPVCAQYSLKSKLVFAIE